MTLRTDNPRPVRRRETPVVRILFNVLNYHALARSAGPRGGVVICGHLTEEVKKRFSNPRCVAMVRASFIIIKEQTFPLRPRRRALWLQKDRRPYLRRRRRDQTCVCLMGANQDRDVVETHALFGLGQYAACDLNRFPLLALGQRRICFAYSAFWVEKAASKNR